jgi:hypothetical protein
MQACYIFLINVKYLLVGGYAVGYHGYPRATGDMDIWIEMSKPNSKKIAATFRDFGMPNEAISESLFLEKNKVIRMGVPPVYKPFNQVGNPWEWGD